MSSDATLPVELERLVFECAAENTSEIPTLVLVAHRVRIWLEPLLYRTIHLSSYNVLELLKAKPAPFLASTVRHVIVWPAVRDPTALGSFLELCLGVTNFASLTIFGVPGLLPALGNMRLQRLSGVIEGLFRDPAKADDNDDEVITVDIGHPLFSTLSHLDILDEIDPEGMGPEWLNDLSTLPALTHLSFNNPPNSEILHTMLQACPRIHVFIAAFHVSGKARAHAYVESMSIRDIRFVVATYSDHYGDWELGTKGGADI
ncbi:hypothetical protein B0H14DRAFT_3866359 [Mycena olivaceomarginata]|nr:hypothetical protein B0H14DRAFT_3866359 [Mycena olivaceomarginata]